MANRINNALSQKLYLINQNVLQRQYTIMGSTGNVYTVNINLKSNCTCPDNKLRKVNCKHIYFVLFKILSVPPSLIDKLDQNTLDNLYKQEYELDSSIIISPEKKILYDNLCNNVVTNNRENDDICPICLDEITDLKDAYYCKNSCKKNVHICCFNMWAKSKGHICVYCSKQWNMQDFSTYINLV